MQKKLIALAVAGIVAGPAFAQSSVQIYGRVDMSYIHKTNDLKAALEDEESTSRLGILGEEDLGGGLKAFFQLEERFNLDQGTAVSNTVGSTTVTRRFDDKAWVGLRSAKLGEIMLGRVVTVLDTIYGGAFEAFGGDTIAQFGTRRAAGSSRVSNGLRYMSPQFGGVNLVAHYGLTEASTGGTQAKAPYGFAAFGTWGKAAAGLGWQKDTTALDSGVAANKPYKTWLVDGSYDFGVVKVVAGYAHSSGYNDGLGTDYSQARKVRYQVGAIVPVGATGTLRADVGRGTEKDNTGAIKPTYTHFGIGYWYGLSKRTTLMANAFYDKQKDSYFSTVDQKDADNQTGVQLGLRHEF